MSKGFKVSLFFVFLLFVVLLILPYFSGNPLSPSRRTLMLMRGIAHAADNYYMEYRRYPSEEELRAFDDGANDRLTFTGDAWRRKMNYIATESVLVIHSYGEDGVLSDDDIYYSTLPEESVPIPDE